MGVPSNSKAVVQPDPASGLLEATTLPVPKAGADEYLVQMRGTSPCLGERTWEKAFPSLFKNRVDRVPGTEGAGVVVGAPEGGEFKVGDKVMFRLDAWLAGTMREYTVVPAANVAAIPPHLSWNEAAATPLSSLTAWQGLFTHGLLDPTGIDSDGEARSKNAALRVLLAGASGSVGAWALRFASLAGAHVVGVGSGAKAKDMQADGAAEVIDYKATSIADWAKTHDHVDLILDCTGRDLASAWAALKDGGVFLSVVGNPAESKPEGKNAKEAKWFLVTPSGTDLARIAAITEKHSYRPMIDCVMAFDNFQEAFDKVDSGKTTGKVVITVSEEGV